MHRLSRILLLNLALGFTLPCWADGGFKLGFVNTERVYLNSKTAKAVQKKIDKEFSDRRARLTSMEKSALQIQKELTKSNLGVQDRMRMERELAALVRDSRAAAEELSQDYALKRNEEFAAIQARANLLLKKMAEEGGFDLILQDAVYVKPQYDLTEQLIKALDK